MTLDQYVVALREFIRDKEELNRLLGWKLENSDSQLQYFVLMALDQFNLVPPLLNPITDVTKFPYWSILILKATDLALASISIKQSRNSITYNNGGITVQPDDPQRYIIVLNKLAQELQTFTDYYRKYKIVKNIANGWGRVNSPYMYLHTRYSSMKPSTLFN